MTDRAAIVAELLADPMRAREVSRADAIALLVDLARVTRALELLPRDEPEPTPAQIELGRWMTVAEVMELTELSRRAVWARSRTIWHGFAVHEGRKTLRFKPGFRKYYTERKA